MPQCMVHFQRWILSSFPNVFDQRRLFLTQYAEASVLLENPGGADSAGHSINWASQQPWETQDWGLQDQVILSFWALASSSEK